MGVKVWFATLFAALDLLGGWACRVVVHAFLSMVGMAVVLMVIAIILLGVDALINLVL